MSTPAAMAIATPTPDARLADILTSRDVACLRCGYNLRGLDPAGPCPECGTPIHHSVATPLLERVNPAWLTRAARGTTLVGAGLGIWIAIGLALALGIGALYALISLGSFAGWRAPMVVGSVVSGIGAATGILLVIVGAALATTPQRALDRAHSFRSWRRGVHLALAIPSVAIPLGAVTLVLLRASDLPRAAYVQLFDLWFLVLAFGTIVVLAVFVGYQRELLVRVPDASLGRRCATDVRLLIAGILVFLVGFELANTLLIPLGDLAQVGAWLIAVIGAIGALGAATRLAVGFGACGRRLAACRRPAAPMPVDPPDRRP